MAKLTRVFQKIFGSTAGVNQIAKFGSLAAGAPAFTTDPSVIQALANYLTGWYGAVIGENSPAIQDMNAICFLFARQLAYLFQAGIPEWDTQTTYFIGSLVTDGTGNVYVSLTDNNLGNALGNFGIWSRTSGPPIADVIVGSAPYCTHATLAAAVADSGTQVNSRVLLTESYTVPTTITLTKAGWRISAYPGVTYSNGAAGTGFNVQAANIEFSQLRLSGFTTGMLYQAAAVYGRVWNCIFASNVATQINDSATPAGKAVTPIGNITEV